MKVKINGQVSELNLSLSIGQLLEAKGINPGEVVVQYNGEIVEKETWPTTMMKDCDELEILRFVGGG